MYQDAGSSAEIIFPEGEIRGAAAEGRTDGRYVYGDSDSGTGGKKLKSSRNETMNHGENHIYNLDTYTDIQRIIYLYPDEIDLAAGLLNEKTTRVSTALHTCMWSPAP